jgi:hypothetical protein
LNKWDFLTVFQGAGKPIPGPRKSAIRQSIKARLKAMNTGICPAATPRVCVLKSSRAGRVQLQAKRGRGLDAAGDPAGIDVENLA